jgi:YbbR domain-containing protein
MLRRPGQKGIETFARKYLLNEIRLKAMALVLAIMLWFSMTYLGESKMAFSVPISFANLNKTMVLREADTRDVLITLDGPVSILRNLRAHDITAPLDLARARDGRQVLAIRKNDINVPNGLKIESVKPDYIVVEIDKIVEKQLRTVVRLDRKWSGIYQVSSWQPRYVRVEGPRELLDKSDLVETIPVDGEFSRQQEVQTVPLNLKSLEAKMARPETVQVVLRRIGG